jgi:L-iditol 2-dehydrogenase
MRALRYYGLGDVVLEETPRPQIGEGEVLVEVRACGVCATDVKTFQRGHPKIRPGTVLGHEVAGVIAQVKGSIPWKVGQRVAVAPYVPCDACSQCLRGNPTLCERLFEVLPEPGGFSEYIRLPSRIAARGMIPLPDSVSFVEAALAEPLACCLHGMQALQVGPGDTVLIIGDGPMGLLQAEVARVMGAARILLSGATTERLERAARVADVVVDVRQEDLEEVIKRETDGGADKVIVSVGETAVNQAALALVRKGGVINFFAGLPKGAQIVVDANQIHYEGVRLLGTFGFAPTHFRTAVDWLGARRVHVRDMVTLTVPLHGVMKALEAAAEHKGIKSVVVMDERKEGPME